MHLIRQQLIQLIKLNNNKDEVVTEDMQLKTPDLS